MKKRIFKFVLLPKDTPSRGEPITIHLHSDAKFLSLQDVRGALCAFYICPDRKVYWGERRHFLMLPTGSEMPYSAWPTGPNQITLRSEKEALGTLPTPFVFLGTVNVDDGYIYHCFEVLTPPAAFGETIITNFIGECDAKATCAPAPDQTCPIGQHKLLWEHEYREPEIPGSTHDQ